MMMLLLMMMGTMPMTANITMTKKTMFYNPLQSKNAIASTLQE